MISPLLIRPGTSDLAVLGAVYNRNVFEAAIPQLAPRLILDLGAYTGISTRWFCDRYPDAEVIGVEPNPESFALATLNAPRAELHETAIGPAWGRTDLQASGRGEWAAHTRAEPGGASIASVFVTPLGMILGDRMPDVVKIDIEGAELGLFRAPCPWLARASLLFVETHDRFLPGCTRAMEIALKRSGREYMIERRKGSGSDFIVRFRT